jgi:hypothetical protein
MLVTLSHEIACEVSTIIISILLSKKQMFIAGCGHLLL